MTAGAATAEHLFACRRQATVRLLDLQHALGLPPTAPAAGIEPTVGLLAEMTPPVDFIGLWRVQRPRIGRLGGLSALAYAYSFVFFTATVAYALVNGTRDFEQLGEELNPR